MQLELTSSFPLQSAIVGLVTDGVPATPVTMEATTEDALLWAGRIDLQSGKKSVIRVAVTAKGAAWYAEVPTVFLDGAE